MKLRLCLVLSLFLCSLCPALFAADLLPRYRFINLATADKSGINTLMQDENGMIWAGGNSGIYRIQHNQLQPIRDLPQQSVNQLQIIPGHGAWLAGSMGLWRWDRHTDNFSQQVCQPKGGIWQLVQSPSATADFLALSPDGVWQIDPANGSCAAFNIHGLPSGAQIERLTLFQHQLVIAVREQGLFRCALPCQQAARFAAELAQVRFRQLVVHNNMLYAGSHKHGFYQLDSAGKIKRHWHKGLPDTLPVNGVMSILPDGDTTLWAGLWAGGLVEFDAYGNRRSHSSFRPADPTAIGGNNIKTLIKARDGTLYAAHEYGVSALVPAFNQYQWLGQAQADQPGLLKSKVQAIYPGDQGEIWIGTSGAGLYRFAPASHKLQQFAADLTGKQHFPSNAIWAIRADRDGSLLLATSAGVVRLQPQTQQWQLLTADLPSQDVFRLSLAPDQAIWISMWSGGVARLTPQGAVDAIWRSSDGLQLDTNQAIEVSAAGEVFVLNTAGLFRLQNQRFSAVVLAEHGKADKLSRDRQGAIWLLTTSGALLRWNDQSEQFLLQQQLAQAMEPIEMFPATTPGQVDFWLLAAQQLLGFAANGKLQTEIPLAGLATHTLLNTAAVNSQQMLLGAEDGLYLAPLQHKAAATSLPNPLLAGMRLFNQPLRLSRAATEKAVAPTQIFGGHLTLNYQQDLLTFEFAVPGIVLAPVALEGKSTQPELRYSYRLHPFDRDWLVAAADEPRATYTRLPPGSYIFELQAQWPDGRITRAEPFQLTVQPPWWLTWWAKTALASLLLLLLTSIMLLRTRTLNSRNQWLAQQVRERTEALEQANQRLQHAAYLDALTGLLNRRGLRAQTEAQWSTWQNQVVLMIGDIDHFKQFNDVHGHQVGDEVLTVLSARLQSICQSADLISRWGGEEFLLLLQGTDAMLRAGELVRAIADQPMALSIGPTRVTMTAGAVWHQGASFDMTLQQADVLLYDGKKAGRNRLVSQSSG